jgi:DNA-binding response OmpR family regulator
MLPLARDARSGLRILFMTGYAADVSRGSGFLEPGMELITKPFVVLDLISRLCALLNSVGPTTG